MTTPSQAQKNAAFTAARRAIDSTGYGGWVNDDACRQLSDAVAIAVVSADTTTAGTPPVAHQKG